MLLHHCLLLQLISSLLLILFVVIEVIILKIIVIIAREVLLSGSDVIALFVILSPYSIKSILVKKVPKWVEIASVLVFDFFALFCKNIKSIFIKFSLKFLNFFLCVLMENCTSAVFIYLFSLLRGDIIAIFIIESTKAVIAVFIESVSIWIKESPIFQKEEAVLVVVTFKFLNLFFLQAFYLNLFRVFTLGLLSRLYHSLKTKTII